jgi:hypothetical protein
LRAPFYYIYLWLVRRVGGYIVGVFFLFAFWTAAEAQTPERITRQYRLTKDFAATDEVPFDTAFSLFHRQRVTDRYSPFNAYQGNYGLPLYQINYFDRVRDPDYYLYQNYYPFMHIPAKATFMETNVPFMDLLFTYAGPTITTAEQNFRFRQSMNLNRHFNIGMVYDIVYSLGHYAYQKAENKNFLLHGSYIKNRYEAYAALGINNIYSNENGGVTDPAGIDQFDIRDVPVRLGGLNRAKSSLRNRNFMLVQKYHPFRPGGGTDKVAEEVQTVIPDSVKRSGLTGSFSHIFIAEGNKRTYFDAVPRSGFYDTAYISNSSYIDSLSSSLLKNTVRFDFSFMSKGGFLIGAGGGIRHELHRYGQIVPGDTLNGQDTIRFGHQNVAVTGRLENRIGEKFGWVAYGDLYIGGYRAGDFDLSGEIAKDFTMKKGTSVIAIDGSVSLTTPSVWYTGWGSNNFKWDFDAAREFRIESGFGFRYPERKMSAGFRYSLVDNYSYFGTDALPAQHTGTLSVAAATIDKTITLGGFNLGATALVQQSSNSDVLSLPLVALRSALWYYHDIHFAITGGRMQVEAGVELFLHTPYKASAYMPATGRYYNQADYEVGGYPFMNAFINAKIKRTRIMLSFDHVNQGLTGINYFLLPRYPLNTRMFRYGLAWTFYD